MDHRCSPVRIALACLAVWIVPPLAPVRAQPTEARRSPVRAVWAHILIAHTEGRRIPGVLRSREEARRRAAEALAMARREGVRFEDAVAKYSDEPFAARRHGRVGPPVTRGQFRGPFKALGDAIFGLRVGEVSDVVESPAGFHVLKRLPLSKYSASQIVIQYKGAAQASSSVTRSEEEARALAERLLEKLQKNPGEFAAVARSESDGPSSAQGGFLGYFETGQIALELELALDQMEVGEVRGLVETPLGFHILKRETFDPAKFHRITVNHILIRYKGAKELRYRDRAKKPKTEVTRTKDEALAFARKILEEARAPGAEFTALARRYSDGPERDVGGEFGAFGWGDTGMSAFEKAAFSLKVGETGGPVETPFGFHIILRTE